MVRVGGHGGAFLPALDVAEVSSAPAVGHVVKFLEVDGQEVAGLGVFVAANWFAGGPVAPVRAGPATPSPRTLRSQSGATSQHTSWEQPRSTSPTPIDAVTHIADAAVTSGIHIGVHARLLSQSRATTASSNRTFTMP
jgi:hypothetical protein